MNGSHSRRDHSARPDVLRSRPGLLFTLDCLEIIGPSKNVLLLFLELPVSVEIKATMKTKTVFSLMIVGLMLILIADGRAVSATPQQKSSVRKEVKVYFYHDPGEYIDLYPVKRLVSARTLTMTTSSDLSNESSTWAQSVCLNVLNCGPQLG